jgi:hypothetical protein
MISFGSLFLGGALCHCWPTALFRRMRLENHLHLGGGRRVEVQHSGLFALDRERARTQHLTIETPTFLL